MTEKAKAILEKTALSPESIAMRVGGFFNRRSKIMDKMVASKMPAIRKAGKELEDTTLSRIEDFENKYIANTRHNERYQRTMNQMLPNYKWESNRPLYKFN